MNEKLTGTIAAKDVLLGTLDLAVEYYKGDTGESGVALSSTAPTDESVSIWIEPDGEATTEFVTNEQLDETIESKGYMTEEQVRALVAELLAQEAK